MSFNKLLGIFITTCAVFVNNCSAQVILRFQENNRYSVRLFDEPQIFNGIKSFSQNLKNVASKYIDYTNINIENDNTIVFNDFIFNKETFSVIHQDKGILGWFILHNDCKSPRNIVLNYRNDEEVYLPKIILFNINSLNINSNCCNEPKAGDLRYRDLKNIYFNKKSILINNLTIVTPLNDPLALLDIYTRRKTNDHCNIL